MVEWALVNKLIPSLVAENKYSAGIVSLLIKRGLQYDDNAWYYGTQAIRDRIDHSETLKNTRVPVLMLMGESDKVVPADLAYKQASLAERTVLHMYPNVAHVGMYENTARMIYDLVNFYSGSHLKIYLLVNSQGLWPKRDAYLRPHRLLILFLCGDRNLLMFSFRCFS